MDRISFVKKRIIYAILMLAMLIAAGTSAYILLEGFNFWDALYMTVITISTVGFKEVRSLSLTGRLITMGLILLGVGLLFYTLGTAIEYFFSDLFLSSFEERRRRKKMQQIKNHYIVCGYGRVGKEVVKALKKAGQEIVVIENDLEKYEEAKKEGLLALFGNAAEENLLIEAGIKNAKGIAACVGNDADNVYITLTSRILEPDIFIVARANSPDVISKLYRAGANRVISPSIIGGKRIAALLTHPRLSEYLDIFTLDEDIEFEIEQYEIAPETTWAGKTLGELGIREKTGCVVLLVKYPDGRLETVPRGNTPITKGSKLVVLGTPEQLDRFEKTFLTGEFILER
jgi:voltage-gated potassium channel